MAAGAASGLVGPLPGLALTSLATDVLLFAWCTVVVNVLSTPHAMRYAMAAWSWSGVIWAAVVVCAWLGHITPLEGDLSRGKPGDVHLRRPELCRHVLDGDHLRGLFHPHAIGPVDEVHRYVLLAWALILTESNGGALAVGAAIFFLLLLRSYRKAASSIRWLRRWSSFWPLEGSSRPSRLARSGRMHSTAANRFWSTPSAAADRARPSAVSWTRS